MITDALPPTENIYQMNDAEQLKLLKSQFTHVYQLMVDFRYVPQARYEKSGLSRGILLECPLSILMLLSDGYKTLKNMTTVLQNS